MDSGASNKNSNRSSSARRRRRQPQGQRGRQGQQNQGQLRDSVEQSSHNHRPHGDKQRRHNRSSGSAQRGKRPIPTREVTSRYDQLLGDHLRNREKYFEWYFRADNQKFNKIVKNLEQSRLALRNFEKTLRPWQKEVLDQKVEFFPLDDEYSSNHPEDQQQDVESHEAIDAKSQRGVSYHVNSVQQSRPDYSDDTEETEGSMLDYQKYKDSQQA